MTRKRIENPDPEKYREPLAFLIRSWVYLQHLFREFQNDHCLVRASSLAFNTLLALVPLLAFVFSLFTAFGNLGQIQEQLQRFLIELFLPAKQEEIMDYLVRFINNTSALGAVGLLIFAVTSILLLNTINENINAVWGSKSRRNFVSKFTTYISVIIFGSLLIAVSFVLTRSIRNIFNLGDPTSGFLVQAAIQVSPFIFIFLTFLLIILVVPAAGISFFSACIGAAVGSLLWNLSKVIFVKGTNYVLRASVMYGSLAAIPIFLVWLYLTWLIILLSLEITFLHQYRGTPWTARNLAAMEPGEQMVFGLDLYFFIADRFRKGLPPPSVAEMAVVFSVTLENIHYLIELFQRSGFIHPVRANETGYIPSKPLNTIKVKEIAEALFGISAAGSGRDSPSYSIISSLFRSALSSVEKTSVEDVLSDKDPTGL